AVVQRALQRFNLPADLRPEMWRMTAEAARDLFPLGGGMGSFPNVYQIHEKLEVVNEHYANRADNDYLELLLEAGVPGVLVLVAIVAILVRTVVQTRHGRRGKGLAQHQFALFSLALLAVHSVLDFPLRPLSIAAVAACCVALLLPGRRPGPSITDPAASPATNEDQPRAAPAPIPLRESGLIAGIGAAFVLCAAGSGLDRATLFSPALIDWVPAPFRSTALTMQAAHLYEAQDGRALLPAAGAALARAPMEAANASLLGGAYGLLGRDAEAEQAYAVSARLGWRIPNTQAYWMFRQMELGNGDAAADRWDALLRVNPALHTNLRLMLPVESSISLRPALLRKLAGNPPWLGRYIDEIELLPAEVMSNRAEILLELAENG
ncbi:MAG TPA: O-antigen ligase family protein, partial [Novosphingobium sp.]|nr:O-antigen ligase family protein [Novosphingobium sp.]